MRERKWALVPMLLHLAAVTAICLTVANVQIITRMVLSNSPLFVWHVAALLQRGGVSMKKALLVPLLLTGAEWQEVRGRKLMIIKDA